MNLRDLAKIDIKTLQQIQVNDIIAFMRSNLDIAIIVSIIGLTLATVLGLYGYSTSKNISLNNQVQTAQELVPVAEKQKELLEEFNTFIKNFPDSIGTNALMEKISGLALDHDIQIKSISPGLTDENTIRSITEMTLTIVSDSYDDIISFTKSIESLPYSITITSWKGYQTNQSNSSRRTRSVNGQTEPDTILINIDMRIQSIQLKEGAS